ncbi:MAG TPA: winged helix DNA-binding domain-containing protein [Gaiellaceae bacterium]|nr:winged helix DNA-binding domain-containing protein [Gaiellaceae bacterium]
MPLTPRELNRATLARQLLLDRADLGACEAIHRLAGLQAQDSNGPYLGLWSRLRDFDRAELTADVMERRVVVATLQRVTMHIVTAADHRWVKPTLQPLFDATKRLPTLRELDHERLLAEARTRFPARIPALRDLAPDGVNLGHFTGYIQSNLPLVRTPPAGTWNVGGSPVQELVEVGEPDPDELVRRYLAAFGPATVRDAQVWSGLTRLREIFARLELEELGDGYFDLPGAPRPDAETPAPVRFLPRYDDLLIGYADRSRFGDVVIGKPAILVDGLVAGTWSWTGDDVDVSLRRVLPEIEDERLRLRDWLVAA